MKSKIGIHVTFLASVVITLPSRAEDPRLPDQWIKAPALKPGDTIAFVAPAGPVNKEPVLRFARELESAGFHVLVPKDIDRRDHYLAGTDDARAAELNAAIRDPKVAAIFPCRGGYGLTRILDRIDYETLRKNPKIVTGFSDLTGLHLAIARKAGLITFHSPMPQGASWQEEGPRAYPTSLLRRALLASSYQKGTEGYSIDLPASHAKPVTLKGGKATGRLVGGNLTLICSTLGTSYALEPEGKILFIEDTGEAPYRIDRSLSQLRLAGVLDKIKGVVAGQFSRTDEKEVERILEDYFGKGKIPALRNFPVGHVQDNATLPHGALVELNAYAPSLRVLENPVRVGN